MPGGAEGTDRAAFWNEVERHHKRGDAVLAREVIIALPAELTEGQRSELAESFAIELSNKYGVAVDLALHAPDRDGSQLNFHAHILKTACHVDQAGTLGKKAVELDPIHCARHKIDDSVAWMRPRWAQLVNESLERAGFAGRVDHRSHVDLGIEFEPTEHVGYGAGREIREARNLERRAKNSELKTIDQEMQHMLHKRAQAAAAEKIAEADRLARQLRGTELRQQLIEIQHEEVAIRASVAAVIEAKRRALPGSVVRQATADLPTAMQSARSAQDAVQVLEQQLTATSVFRWFRRRTLSKRLAAAQAMAHRLLEEAAATRIEARAPQMEAVRQQEQQAKQRLQMLAGDRDAIGQERAHLDQAAAPGLGSNQSSRPSTNEKSRPTSLSREMARPAPTSRQKRRLQP